MDAFFTNGNIIQKQKREFTLSLFINLPDDSRVSTFMLHRVTMA